MRERQDKRKRTPGAAERSTDPPITREDVERAIRRLRPEQWNVLGKKKWEIRWEESISSEVEILKEGLRVETVVEVPIESEEMFPAMAKTLALNEVYEAGTFVLDVNAGQFKHRFNLYCCDRDTVSCYTIMFAISAGKTIFTENSDTMFGNPLDSGHSSQPDPMIHRGASMSKMTSYESMLGENAPRRHSRTGSWTPEGQKSHWEPLRTVRNNTVKAPLGEDSPAGGTTVTWWGDTRCIASDITNWMIVGSTGSGKSQGMVGGTVINCGEAGESLFLTDPKGEHYSAFAPWLRERGYRIVHINFRDPLYSDTYNPLWRPYTLYKTGNPADMATASYMIARLSKIIIKDDRQDPQWSAGARGLFSGIASLLFEYGDEREISLGSIMNIVSTAFSDISGLRSFLYELDEGSSMRRNIAGVADVAADNTRCGYVAVLQASLSEYCRDEALSAMMSGKSADFSGMGRRKTAVFVEMPDETSAYDGIASLCVEEFYSELISDARDSPGLKLQRPVNIILEEYGNLYLPDSPAMLSACRSRNIRMYLVIQSLGQLSKYGENSSTILSNAPNMVFLHSVEPELLRYVSERIGYDGEGDPLIRTGDLERLPRDKAIMIYSSRRLHPAIVDVRYYHTYYTPVQPGSPERRVDLRAPLLSFKAVKWRHQNGPPYFTRDAGNPLN